MSGVKIKQFKNNNGEPVAGLTPEYAVYDKNTGKRLDAKIGEIQSKITELEDEVFDKEFVEPKNWLNTNDEDFLLGKYISGGTISTSSSYNASGYIPVKVGETYQLSYSNEIEVKRLCRFVDTYDSSKSLKRKLSNVYSLEIQEGEAYVRISADSRFFKKSENAMYWYGDVPLQYTDFFEPYSIDSIKANLVSNDSIKDGSISRSKLLGVFPLSIGSFSNKSQLAPSQYVSLQTLRVSRNSIMTACIIGAVQSVRVMAASDAYIDITPTKLIVNNCGVVSELVHGVTIGFCTLLTISKKSSIYVSIRLSNDMGDVYEKEDVDLRYTQCTPAIQNNNTTDSIVATIKHFPKDLACKIWGFGDSYFSYTDPSRWTYYASQWGAEKWLLNSVGGETATEALADLKLLLSLGSRPSIILWCLGMNNGADNDGAVNQTWLKVTNEVEQICADNGIELVLATIPSVPSQKHIKLNEWIRNSGHRFVDFAEAVELDNSVGTWKNGLLSNDNVHPSQNGAKVLASRVFADLPEITINS